MKLKLDREYKSFLEDIKERVRASQYEAFKAVNKELITLLAPMVQEISWI